MVDKDLKRRGKYLRGHFLSLMEEKGESLDRLQNSCLAGGIADYCENSDDQQLRSSSDVVL